MDLYKYVVRFLFVTIFKLLNDSSFDVVLRFVLLAILSSWVILCGQSFPIIASVFNEMSYDFFRR